MGQFPEVAPTLDLPDLDRKVLDLWRERKVFERSLDQRVDAKPFVFYEGPPTANGAPGVHHVEARVVKDLFPRFKTMRGYRVERKGGWDCHGLPVELEVEKELGLATKRDIEAYGIGRFNARCRESVERYVDACESLTERVGFWIDTSQAYWTMDTSYIESVWWALAELYRRGLLVEDYKVVPYCPRPRGRWPPRAPRCWCGRPSPGRWCRTSRWWSAPGSPTCWSRWSATAPGASWWSPGTWSSRRSARTRACCARCRSPSWSARATSAHSTWSRSPRRKPTAAGGWWPTTM